MLLGLWYVVVVVIVQFLGGHRDVTITVLVLSVMCYVAVTIVLFCHLCVLYRHY